MKDTKNRVHLNVDGKTTAFTMADVIDCYARGHMGARDIMSGCRRIGEVVGDWRPIDYIAQSVLDYFKGVNIKGLRAASIKHGLTPKF